MGLGPRRSPALSLSEGANLLSPPGLSLDLSVPSMEAGGFLCGLQLLSRLKSMEWGRQLGSGAGKGPWDGQAWFLCPGRRINQGPLGRVVVWPWTNTSGSS